MRRALQISPFFVVKGAVDNLVDTPFFALRVLMDAASTAFLPSDRVRSAVP